VSEEATSGKGANTQDTISWEGGGTAFVTAADDDRLTVWSTRPAAPGQPIVGTRAGGSLRLKVARARRVGERFELVGRLVDATRALRLELEAEARQRSCGPAGPPGAP
jgi:hypothetical protein